MMKLGFFLYGTGHHIASWRDPGVVPNANQSLQHYIDITQTAERGLFDFVFNADSNSTFGPDDPEMWKRTTNAMRLEPLTLLGALSAVTSAHRTDLDGDHDLSRSVPRGADVRHARPVEPGPHRLERGDVVGGVGGVQLQPRQARAARRPLPPRHRVHRGRRRGCGTPGRTTPSSWTRRRACSSTPPRCTCSITRASTSRCAGR